MGGSIAQIGGSYFAGRAQARGYSRGREMIGEYTDRAIGGLDEGYDRAEGFYRPYREYGEAALSEYGALWGIGEVGEDGEIGAISGPDMEAARERFKATPGYEFRFDEGVRALDRSAAARGDLGGGGYGRDLETFGQGIASAEFGNYANRLAGLADQGFQAASGSAGAALTTGANKASAYMGGGQGMAQMSGLEGTARASGYMGMANAFAKGDQNAQEWVMRMYGGGMGGGMMGGGG